ncbi:ATP-binding cassette domain-containing protein [Streptomyces sp. NPDC001780]
MLQAIGLTSEPRRDLPPAVDNLSFEAPPGAVTALLGVPGAGKTTALRLMLDLEPGRGTTLFRGRPLHRLSRPCREIGVLLGDVPGHPARTARGQLRMLAAAVGVPAARADELLDIVGLGALRGERLGTLSLGMDRRLGLACALLGDPHTLLLDAPSAGLSPRESGWLFGLLRAHAGRGGTVLYTTADSKEAARTADHVVTLDAGRLVAAQDVASFARTRLRPRVAVRTPHAARLADALSREARARRRSVEVVTEAGSRITVYGSSCPEIGETAFRHGVLVHQLADEIGDTGVPAPGSLPAPGLVPGPAPAPGTDDRAVRVPRPDPDRADGSPYGHPRGGRPGDARRERGDHRPRSADGRDGRTGGGRRTPPGLGRPVRGPLRPVRYELRRMFGTPAALLAVAAVLVPSVLIAVPLARAGRTPLADLLAAWPALLPLPPAALGAGLLGALSFGEEFRYPALAEARGCVPRRLGLLLAKLAVTAGAALLLALLTAAADLGALRLVYGADAVPVPDNWPELAVDWAALTVGCGWVGLLGAGVFRITMAGVASVVVVPTVVVPLLRTVLDGPSVRTAAGFTRRLHESGWAAWLDWSHQVDRWLPVLSGLLAQPVALALALSLTALLCAYLFIGLSRRVRW